jgi:hypothetical protein
MRITPFFVGVVAALGTAAAASAQFSPGNDLRLSQDAGIVPSVFPVAYSDGPASVEPDRLPTSQPAAAPGGTSLDRVTASIRAVAGEQTDPVATLTGQPTAQLPHGAYPSPYFTDGPGCCGPLGRNGRIGYELYTYVGINWPFGEGAFGRHLNTGVVVGGGGRSLFFDPTHTAAWVLDLGLSYTYNRGELGHPVLAYVQQAPIRNPLTGQTTPRPDVIRDVAIRGLYRTNFNFGVGRDWWLWGAASTGVADGPNWRVGGLVGGRWGTAHVDLVPSNTVRFGDYQRRQNVTHGIFLATHSTVDIPMGSWILFGGFRFEWGYDWTNLIPPLEGNLHNFNLMLTAGIRY